MLSVALWAHRVSKHGDTKVTPFELVYGQEAMLPVEINLQAVRVAHQNGPTAGECYDKMMDRIDEVHEGHRALEEIEKENMKVARDYNKKVRAESFRIMDFVWKTILPVGHRDSKFGKWSLS